jgi:hypothetical protein
VFEIQVRFAVPVLHDVVPHAKAAMLFADP